MPCHVIPCDLGNLEDVKLVFDRAVEAAGEIHVLVNNAGMLIRSDSVDVTLEDWNTVSYDHPTIQDGS